MSCGDGVVVVGAGAGGASRLELPRGGGGGSGKGWRSATGEAAAWVRTWGMGREGGVWTSGAVCVCSRACAGPGGQEVEFVGDRL